jgi:hypothetical protein
MEPTVSGALGNDAPDDPSLGTASLTFRHGGGLAPASGDGALHAVYAWLVRNAKDYGFKRTVPSEKWHWEAWWRVSAARSLST